MHKCQKLDLFDLDTKLMTSVGPVYRQQETSSRYCKLLMLQHWKAPSVEAVSKFTSGPRRVVGEIAQTNRITPLSRATSADFWIKQAQS
jgi:hypothetical protein